MASVIVYLRGDDAVAAPWHSLESGIQVRSPDVVAIDWTEASDADLGEIVLRALESARAVLDEPPAGAQQALLDAFGVKREATLMRNLRAVDIVVADGELHVQPMYNRGKGFDIGDATASFADPDPAELGGAVRDAMRRSTNRGE